MMHTCIACGSQKERPRLFLGDCHISECSTCQLARTLPESYVEQSDYDQDQHFSESYARRETDFRRYSSLVLSWLRPYVPTGRLLDIGCSIGVLVDEANRTGYSAEGIDLDSAAVQYGRSMGRPLHRVSAEDWQGGYRAITLQHTLEHVPDPVSFLKCCASLLDQDGWMLVVVPCHDGLNPRVLGGRWYGWQVRQHYYHYSRLSLRRLFQASGLADVRIWQNSMDHHVCWSDHRTAIKSIADVTLATFGHLLGRGDQLVGVARRLNSPV
jgi:SAM-dependent methyltransferase